MWGIFRWNAEGFYPAKDAIRTYKVEWHAVRRCDEMNETQPVYVVRTIMTFEAGN